MRRTITIVLRGDPVGKGRPKFVRATGRAYTPAKTATYESAFKAAATDAMRGRPWLEGPLVVDIVAEFSVPASWSGKRKQMALAGIIRPTPKPDADNIIKICADACNDVVYRDDAAIVDLRVRKRYAALPALSMRITELFDVDATAADRAASVQVEEIAA